MIQKKIFTTFKIYQILKKFEKMKIQKEILFSSVVPLAFKKLRQSLKGSKYKIIEVKDLNLKRLIKINIKNIKQLGSDRIVNSIEGKKFKKLFNH